MRKLVWGLLFNFYVFGLNPLSAVIYCEIDTTAPLRCSFSSNHPNRIMVKDQGVDKIIHSEPDRLQILIDDKANQAFIIAREVIRDPITLCVVTTSGAVQDLEVNFEQRPAQLVILENQKPAVSVEEVKCIDSSCCSIQQIINSLLAGLAPKGFCEVEFVSETYWPQKKLRVVETNRFEKADELIRVFKISNCSKRRQVIHEREFSSEHSSWVFLEKNCLAARETILVIVSLKRGR